MRGSLVALAGTITAVLGVVLMGVIPAIGLFFVAMGVVIVIASPVVGLMNRSTDGSDG